MQEKIAADTQYAVGAFDAIAGLLAIIAKHQGLDLKDDLGKLVESAKVYHPKLEAHRANGFENAIAKFESVFRQR